MVQLSNDTGLAVMRPLSAWSWKDISDIYGVLGQVLDSYKRISQRIEVPPPHIDYSDEENTFLMRWYSDIKRVDAQINALDQEIKRRNNLIGVIG